MVGGALLGLVVACALWWAYFDVVALVSERHFRELRAMRLVRVARDSYSYLHLPMIAGIVLVALGVKKAIGHVEEPLETVPGGGAVRRDRALLRGAPRLPAAERRHVSTGPGWWPRSACLA